MSKKMLTKTIGDFPEITEKITKGMDEKQILALLSERWKNEGNEVIKLVRNNFGDAMKNEK